VAIPWNLKGDYKGLGLRRNHGLSERTYESRAITFGGTDNKSGNPVVPHWLCKVMYGQSRARGPLGKKKAFKSDPFYWLIV